MLTDFENGNPELAERFNELMAVARKVENISGGGEVKVQHTSTGININVERRRGGGGGSGTTIHKAFAKAAAGTGSTIVCYLNEDTGEEEDEITVTCEIVDGADLNEAAPRLNDGTLLWVTYDNGTWRHVGLPFNGTEDCP